jgi:hypothetical protein
MARQLTRAERRIVEAWTAAKGDDPTLTQREWAASAMPASVTRGKREVYRTPETRARDLRRILSGKDTRKRTRSLESQAHDFLRASQSSPRHPQVVNLELQDDSGRIIGYANVLLPPGTSTLDIYSMKDSPQGKQLAKQIARRARRDSPPYIVDTITDPITGRTIARQVVDPATGSPAGQPRIARVRSLARPSTRRYVGTFRK